MNVGVQNQLILELNIDLSKLSLFRLENLTKTLFYKFSKNRKNKNFSVYNFIFSV
jgi:hypothetical protein